MANNTSGYIIIDEPKNSSLSHFVVSPLIILFAAILVPFFWSPPFAGRLWIPLIWILFNGYALGSATWKKEWITCIVGALAMALIIFLPSLMQLSSGVLPYQRIVLNGALFLTLYFAIFTQFPSYSIFEYMRDKGAQ